MTSQVKDPKHDSPEQEDMLRPKQEDRDVVDVPYVRQVHSVKNDLSTKETHSLPRFELFLQAMHNWDREL
jgi:hypothetical protein